MLESGLLAGVVFLLGGVHGRLLGVLVLLRVGLDGRVVVGAFEKGLVSGGGGGGGEVRWGVRGNILLVLHVRLLLGVGWIWLVGRNGAWLGCQSGGLE